MPVEASADGQSQIKQRGLCAPGLIMAKRMIVIRFSGIADDRLIATKTAELREHVADHKLSVTGEPVVAFYNPPWTLPLFRRNEIMLELDGA
jgi:hypothetical protein